MVGSCDYSSGKRRTGNEVTLAVGPRIALAGGADHNDHALIPDKLCGRHVDLVLLRDGTSTRASSSPPAGPGAFKADWKRRVKAAPFETAILKVRNFRDSRISKSLIQSWDAGSVVPIV